MRIDKNHWLITKPIAHRGLWGGDIVENSLSAYQNAANNGYPIEIDVYITKDGELVSFHDQTLSRMTEVDGNVFDKTLNQLQTLRLAGSDQTIPTLEQVLEIAENKSPLLIEIKNQPNKKVVDKLVERLKNYKGDFAVQSFNPFYIARVKKLAPEFIRGVLANPVAKHKKPLQRWTIRKMPFNFLAKPDFLSIFHGALPVKKSKAKNCRIITWTVTNQATADKIKPYAENVIFEHFIPKR